MADDETTDEPEPLFTREQVNDEVTEAMACEILERRRRRMDILAAHAIGESAHNLMGAGEAWQADATMRGEVAEEAARALKRIYRRLGRRH
jgi:hypothetical protein